MPKQMPEAVPEVSLEGLGSKPKTTTYELQHDGYENHKVIFPTRPGPEPTITTDEPQEQLDQLGSEEIWDEMLRRAKELPGVTEGDSVISVKGARAFFLPEDLINGPKDS